MTIYNALSVHSGRQKWKRRLDIFSIVMGSDSLAPCLLSLSNHLLSWHFNELRSDATPQYSLMSRPHSKRWVIQLNLDKVIHTCTYRMRTSGSQSMRCQFLCEVYKRATRNFKVILILETIPGMVILVTCRTFDVSFFFLLQCNEYLEKKKILRQHLSKSPCGAAQDKPPLLSFLRHMESILFTLPLWNTTIYYILYSWQSKQSPARLKKNNLMSNMAYSSHNWEAKHKGKSWRWWLDNQLKALISLPNSFFPNFVVKLFSGENTKSS